MIDPATRVRCACGATFESGSESATHRYIRSTPECWAAFGTVLAREYEHPALFGAVHQLTVDAYAAQHPQDQPAKSLVAHLVSLCAVLERGSHGPMAIKAFVESRRDVPALAAPPAIGTLTVADVVPAGSETEHRDLVRRWAREVWDAWSAHHVAIRQLLDA
jgi:hypothetical protein